MKACTWLKSKSLKFAGHCNVAICEGEHFVLLWHPSNGSTGAERGECRVFITHETLQNSHFATEKSPANVWSRTTIFFI